MSANGYAVVGVYLDLLRFGAASTAVAVGARTLWGLSRARQCLSGAVLRDNSGGGLRGTLESRGYLSALLAYLLLGLALASWVMLYLLLESLVGESPGAMCIYGVTRVGEGSPGITGRLPALVAGVQIMKPVLVFVGGAVVVLYWLYRRAGTQALLPRFVTGLLALGLLGLVDVAAESAYLLIPKRDVAYSTGCCSPAALDRRDGPPAEAGEPAWLRPAYFAASTLLAGGLWTAARSSCTGQSGVLLAVFLAAAAATLWLAARFLLEVAAPVLLHLPYHHCLYDLVGTVHESAVAIGLLLWGTFCVGWACVAAWCGRTVDSLPYLATEIRRLHAWGAAGYLGSAVMFAVDLWLA